MPALPRLMGREPLKLVRPRVGAVWELFDLDGSVGPVACAERALRVAVFCGSASRVAVV